MTKLSERVAEIKSSEAASKSQKEKLERKKVKAIKANLLAEFEIGFANELEILKEESITWKPMMQDERYEHLGTYIQFKRKGKILNMDFSNRKSYRLEFVSHSHRPYGGTMVYGDWSKDRFLVWISDNLITD